MGCLVSVMRKSLGTPLCKGGQGGFPCQGTPRFGSDATLGMAYLKPHPSGADSLVSPWMNCIDAYGPVCCIYYKESFGIDIQFKKLKGQINLMDA